jgi:hypothetical protein
MLQIELEVFSAICTFSHISQSHKPQSFSPYRCVLDICVLREPHGLGRTVAAEEDQQSALQ